MPSISKSTGCPRGNGKFDGCTHPQKSGSQNDQFSEICGSSGLAQVEIDTRLSITCKTASNGKTCITVTRTTRCGEECQTHSKELNAVSTREIIAMVNDENGKFLNEAFRNADDRCWGEALQARADEEDRWCRPSEPRYISVSCPEMYGKSAVQPSPRGMGALQCSSFATNPDLASWASNQMPEPTPCLHAIGHLSETQSGSRSCIHVPQSCRSARNALISDQDRSKQAGNSTSHAGSHSGAKLQKVSVLKKLKPKMSKASEAVALAVRSGKGKTNEARSLAFLCEDASKQIQSAITGGFWTGGKPTKCCDEGAMRSRLGNPESSSDWEVTCAGRANPAEQKRIFMDFKEYVPRAASDKYAVFVVLCMVDEVMRENVAKVIQRAYRRHRFRRLAKRALAERKESGSIATGTQRTLKAWMRTWVSSLVNSSRVSNDVAFVAAELLDCARQAATHKYACRVFNHILAAKWRSKEAHSLIEAVLDASAEIWNKEYGTYVIQATLEHGTPEQRRKISKMLIEGLPTNFLNSEGGDQVAESIFVLVSAIKYSEPADKQSIAGLLSGDVATVREIAGRKYGSILLRELLKLDAKTRDKLLSHMRSAAGDLVNESSDSRARKGLEELLRGEYS